MTNIVKCKTCSAEVSGTKAFCPECGSAMVDEDMRQHTSEHESYEDTMRLTKSGYNLMLSEMDLNISDAPNLTAERINLSKDFRDSLQLKPIDTGDGSGTGKKWVVAAVAGALLLLLAGIVIMLFILKPFSA